MFSPSASIEQVAYRRSRRALDRTGSSWHPPCYGPGAPRPPLRVPNARRLPNDAQNIPEIRVSSHDRRIRTCRCARRRPIALLVGLSLLCNSSAGTAAREAPPTATPDEIRTRDPLPRERDVRAHRRRHHRRAVDRAATPGSSSSSRCPRARCPTASTPIRCARSCSSTWRTAPINCASASCSRSARPSSSPPTRPAAAPS